MRAVRSGRALAALLLALALAGCAGDGAGNGDTADDAAPEVVDTGAADGEGDDGAAPADNPVAEAARRTVESESSRVVYDATFDGPEGAYSFDARGEMHYQDHRGRMVYDLSELPGSGGDEVEVRLDGGVVFVRFPPGSGDIELPEGKEWVRIRLGLEQQAAEEQPAPAAGLAVGGVQQDPTQFLRYLVSGARDVIREGREDVRGVETTIYTALIDLPRVAEQGGDELGRSEEQREASRKSAEQLQEQLGTPEVSVTVNVDGDGLIRRLLLSFELQSGEGTQPVSALTTTEYHEFGVEVDVQAPPDELVIEATEIP